jgi:hypothetical protein
MWLQDLDDKGYLINRNILMGNGVNTSEDATRFFELLLKINTETEVVCVQGYII